MSTSTNNPNKKTRRPIVFLLLGLVLFGEAGLLIGGMRPQPPATPQATYQYATEQSIQNDVRYRQSSFFGNSPGATNTAYIADLTDSIRTQLQYEFQANQTTNLSYTYAAKAIIQSTYTNHNAEDNQADERKTAHRYAKAQAQRRYSLYRLPPVGKTV